MWRATTDAEANYIFDLLANRDASAPSLDYAQWLDNQGDHDRAEFLRLELQPVANEQRLQALRVRLDSRWLAKVTSRRFRVDDNVRILRGLFAGIEGSVRAVDAERGQAGLLLHLFARPELIWVAFTDLVRL